MGKAKKKTKHVQLQEEVTAGNRRSSRVSIPSQRLREAGDRSEVSTLTQMEFENEVDVREVHRRDTMEEIEERSENMAQQLKMAQSQIEELQHQLNEVLSAQIVQTTSANDKELFPSGKNLMEQPSTSTGIHINATDRHIEHPTVPALNNISADVSQQSNGMHASTTDLQQMLANAMNQLMNRDSQDNEGKKLISDYLVLGATLDPKVKSKIWSKEFVDLSSLKHDWVETEVDLSVQDNGRPAISVKPSKSSPPANVYQWISLFGVYAAVYLERFPQEAPHLMTYIVRILELSRKHQGFVWTAYDDKFRRIRAYVDAPWHVTNWELMHQAMATNVPQVQNFQRNLPFRRDGPRQQNNNQTEPTYRTPRGFCYSQIQT